MTISIGVTVQIKAESIPAFLTAIEVRACACAARACARAPSFPFPPAPAPIHDVFIWLTRWMGTRVILLAFNFVLI